MAKPCVLSWAVANVNRGAADIDIFDVIGDPWGEGVSASDFVKQLRALNVSRINLHINSPGGYVSDALVMYNAILAHPAETYAYNIGAAHSAASFVMQAANHRLIAKQASMLIHGAQGFVMGDKLDAHDLELLLDEESRNIAGIYAEKTGESVDEWLVRMYAGSGSFRGTTYRGQEAVDVGLADEVGIPQTITDQHMQRVAALLRVTNTDESEEPQGFDLAAAMKAAKLQPPTPNLERLLEGRPLTAAFGKESK